MGRRLGRTIPCVPLPGILLAALAWASPVAAQDSGCDELQCKMSNGSCGWPDGGGGCVSTLAEAECRMAGGCDWVGNACWYPANGGCYPEAQAECILAGAEWKNGECVVPDSGEPIGAAEPPPVALLLSGALAILLYLEHRRRNSRR